MSEKSIWRSVARLLEFSGIDRHRVAFQNFVPSLQRGRIKSAYLHLSKWDYRGVSVVLAWLETTQTYSWQLSTASEMGQTWCTTYSVLCHHSSVSVEHGINYFSVNGPDCETSAENSNRQTWKSLDCRRKGQNNIVLDTVDWTSVL